MYKQVDKTENARCGPSIEMLLKDYIDCESDATSKSLANMSNINMMSEEVTIESPEIDQVITTISDDDIFEIECSSIAEEVTIDDEKVFDKLPQNSGIVVKDCVNGLRNSMTDNVDDFIIDERITSKHSLANNEFDTIFNKFLPDNEMTEVDGSSLNNTPSDTNDKVDIVSMDTNQDHIYEANNENSVTETNTTEKEDIVPTIEISDKPYKCPICDKLFSRNSSLKCHIRLHIEGPDSLLRNTSESENNLKSYVELNQPKEVTAEPITNGDATPVDTNEKEVFKCPKCPQTFPKQNTYAWHLKMHETNVRRKSSDISTTQHTTLSNGNETDVEMSTVDNSETKHESAENNEMKDTSDVNIYECHLCDKSFPRVRSLKTHMGVHKKPSGKDDSANDSLNAIAYEEVSSRKYSCCTKNHVHGDEVIKLYKCNVCYKCYCNISNLKKHLVCNHQDDTDEASDDEYTQRSAQITCDICERTFTNLRALRRHMAVHSDETKDTKARIIISGLYKCGVCDDTFDHIELLGEHVDVHIRAHNNLLERQASSQDKNSNNDNEELFCVVCERSFSNANTLKRHMNCHRRVEEEIIGRVSFSGRKIRDPRNTRDDERRNSKDSGPSPIKCISCNRSFETARAKRIHDAHKHPNLESPPQEVAEVFCDCCNRPWANGRALRMHLTMTRTKLSLVEAENNAEDVQETKEDKTEQTEMSSEKSSHLDSLKCSCCDRLFTSIRALSLHVSRQSSGLVDDPAVSEEEENDTGNDSMFNLIKCDRCDRFFSSIRALKLHISEHTKKPIVQPAQPQPEINQAMETEESSSQETNPTEPESNDAKDNKNESTHTILEDGKYQCNVCQRTFESAKGMSRHWSVHKDQANAPEGSQTNGETTADESRLDFQCPKCDRAFVTENSLRVHKGYHTKLESSEQGDHRAYTILKNGTYQCNVCKRIFESAKGMIIHSNVHKDKENAPEELQTTAETTLEESQTIAETTADEPKQDFQCPKCDRSFVTENSLRVHKGYHTKLESSEQSDQVAYTVLKNGTYQCNICKRIFESAKGIFRHSSVHKDKDDSMVEGYYQCAKCDRSFTSSQALAGHMSVHKRPDNEDKEGNRSASKVSSENHEVGKERNTPNVDEESERKFPCLKCGQVFTSGRALGGHMSRHSIDSENQESNRSSTKASKNHESENHKDAPNEDAESESKFPCLKCGQVFTSGRALGGHMSRHNKEPEIEPEIEIFQCDACDKSFNNAKSLAGHKAVHSKQEDETKEYVCSKCDRKYATDRALFGHMRYCKIKKLDRPDDATTPGPSESAEVADNETPAPKDEPAPKPNDDAGVDAAAEDSMELSCTIKDDHVIAEKSLDGDKSLKKCDICALTFDNLKDLAKHSASHETNGKLDLSDLHIRVHHCNHCDRIFANRVGLRRHSLTHSDVQTTPAPPALTFACPSCPMMFATAIGRKRHSIVHRNKKVADSTNHIDHSVADNSTNQIDHSIDNNSTNQTDQKSVVEISESTNEAKDELVSSNIDESKEPDPPSGTERPPTETGIESTKIQNTDEQMDTSVQVSADEESADDTEPFDQSRSQTVNGHDSTENTLNCKICPRRFATAKALKRHIMFHKFNDFAEDTEITEESVQIVSHKNDDDQSNTSTETLPKGGIADLYAACLKCDICDETFKRVKYLEKHSIEVHNTKITTPVSFNCVLCGKSFQRGNALQLHLKLHENRSSSDVPFECASCEKCFRLRDDLVEHFKTHTDTETGDKVVQNGINHDEPTDDSRMNGDCSDDNEGSENFELRIEDDEDVEEDQSNEPTPIASRNLHQCSYCDKAYRRKCFLATHLRAHRKEIKNTPTDKSSKEHEKNSPPKPYKCVICEKTFRSKSVLAMHTTIHSNDKLRKSMKRLNSTSFTEDDGLRSSKRIQKNES